MNCNDYLEQISSVVDSRLFGNLLEEFNEHSRKCKNCCSVFELEKLTRDYIRSTIKPLKAPDYLNQGILMHLNNPASDERVKKKFNLGLFSFPRRNWYLGFAVAVIAVISLITITHYSNSPHHFHNSPNDNNIIHLVYNYYDSVLEGKMKPDIETSSIDTIESHLRNAVDYDVKVPIIKEYLLMGATVTEYEGKKLAHFFYKRDNCIIYFSQLDYRVVTDEGTLTLPAQAIEQLNTTGWYVADKYKCCSVILWLRDKTLCTVASEMDQKKLMAYLTSNE